MTTDTDRKQTETPTGGVPQAAQEDAAAILRWDAQIASEDADPDADTDESAVAM